MESIDTRRNTRPRSRDVARLTDRLVARTEELLAAHEALRSLARMKQEFLQLVSHELRTPLTSILGLSEFLGKYPFSSSEEVRELANGIRAEGLRLTRFVEEAVEYLELCGGIYPLRPTAFDLAREIDHVAAACLAEHATKRLDVRVTRPESLVLVADSRLFRRTLSRLLDNALKFSRPGGVVEVSAREYRDRPEDRWIVVRIADAGEGVARECLGQLFDPFAICHPYAHHTRGWGLGLAIALAAVRLHGGHLGVASDGLGEGCEVVLRVPSPSLEDIAGSETPRAE